MNAISGSDPTDAGTLWQEVRPELDDVMHELSEADRTAVVLRYFEGRNLKEVGYHSIHALTEEPSMANVFTAKAAIPPTTDTQRHYATHTNTERSNLR